VLDSSSGQKELWVLVHDFAIGEGGLHFIGGDDVETYSACFGGDQEDEHLRVIVELVNYLGPYCYDDSFKGVYVHQGPWNHLVLHRNNSFVP
jgi:hypothetical protein